MNTTRITRRFALLAVAAGIAGCTARPAPTAAPPPTPTTKGTIGVSLLDLGNPFFKVMADSIEAEAKKNGYEVIITSGDKDAAKQKDQVKDFIVKKVSAIVLSPCDSRAVGTTIQEANQAGIPVFTADIACLDKGARVVSHVATDNYLGGKLAGQAMVDALGGKGKVAIIDFPEVESVLLRTKGFRETVAKSPGIQIVADLPGGAAADTANKVARDILEKHADLDGIFCINDPTAYGAIAAIEQSGRQGKVKIISFDGQPEAKQDIKAGKIVSEPVQYPEQIGAMTVRSIMKYLAGDKVDAQILIPPALYTKADADKDTTLK